MQLTICKDQNMRKIPEYLATSGKGTKNTQSKNRTKATMLKQPTPDIKQQENSIKILFCNKFAPAGIKFNGKKIGIKNNTLRPVNWLDN